jgi:hypothetical protein
MVNQNNTNFQYNNNQNTMVNQNTNIYQYNNNPNMYNQNGYGYNYNPQYFNNGNIINQTTAMAYQNTMVGSQYSTFVPNYPQTNVMPMMQSQVSPIYQNGQNNLYNQYGMNNNQAMGNFMMSQSAGNVFNKSKNTSIIRIFQCLYGVIKSSVTNNYFNLVNSIAEYNKNISISLDILTILNNFIDNFPYQKINNNFLNNIQQLRNKISSKGGTNNKFQGNEEIEPKWVFSELFRQFNNEFVNKSDNKENDIPFQNKVFNGLNDPIYLPRDSFPQIYEDIKQFERNYANPLVDFFYFILVVLTKCNKCGKIIDAKAKVSYFINPIEISGANVSNLIMNFMAFPLEANSNENQYCNLCNSNDNVKKEYSFLNTPKYLIIDFQRNYNSNYYLDNKINLTQYAMSNIGPTIYNLYTVITKNNQTYVAYITYRNKYFKFFDKNNIQEVLYQEVINCTAPVFAIYQGDS